MFIYVEWNAMYIKFKTVGSLYLFEDRKKIIIFVSSLQNFVCAIISRAICIQILAGKLFE